jgi:hypothetical protein
MRAFALCTDWLENHRSFSHRSCASRQSIRFNRRSDGGTFTKITHECDTNETNASLDGSDQLDHCYRCTRASHNRVCHLLCLDSV